MSDPRWEHIAGEMLVKEHALRVQLAKNEAAFERIRSLLRGLPRSATAESIDRVCAEALTGAQRN